MILFVKKDYFVLMVVMTTACCWLCVCSSSLSTAVEARTKTGTLGLFWVTNVTGKKGDWVIRNDIRKILIQIKRCIVYWTFDEKVQMPTSSDKQTRLGPCFCCDFFQVAHFYSKIWFTIDKNHPDPSFSLSTHVVLTRAGTKTCGFRNSD
jgi:hypothetical protein